MKKRIFTVFAIFALILLVYTINIPNTYASKIPDIMDPGPGSGTPSEPNYVITGINETLLVHRNDNENLLQGVQASSVSGNHTANLSAVIVVYTDGSLPVEYKESEFYTHTVGLYLVRYDLIINNVRVKYAYRYMMVIPTTVTKTSVRGILSDLGLGVSNVSDLDGVSNALGLMEAVHQAWSNGTTHIYGTSGGFNQLDPAGFHSEYGFYVGLTFRAQ